MHSWDSVVYVNKFKRDVQGTDILSGFLYSMDERINHEPLKDIEVDVSICRQSPARGAPLRSVSTAL
jgi:hypothetical protein